MNFKVLNEEKYTVVSVKAEKLDAQIAPDLKNELIQLQKNAVNTIIIDLSATRYCDSSGLSAILFANRICKDVNGMLILAGLQPTVLKMIAIAQLDKVLTIMPDCAAAIARLND
ncbi:MAG: hypothetical protein RLZZ493_1238 [Bacteroidota bacterium]|jgi:anti-sigma B factor antagonist